jgi:hypothetical protein
MNTAVTWSQWLQQTFQPTSRGVVGLVDDLLNSCPEDGLHLEWHAGVCRVRPALVMEPSAEVPCPKSAFRALIARVATLCNERRPAPISPYGGQGELSADRNAKSVIQAAFINTSNEQWLELRPVRVERPGIGESPKQDSEITQDTELARPRANANGNRSRSKPGDESPVR